MKLGWHVVRNPGQQQISDPSINRHELELNFFRTKSPWNDIAEDQVGIKSLRSRLKDVLSSLQATAIQIIEPKIDVRKLHDAPLEIDDLLHPSEQLSSSSSEHIETWLRQVYDTSRGFELGTFGGHILATTMKRQSSKWTSISLGYISDVVVLLHRFISAAFSAVCHDADVMSALVNAMTEKLTQRYRTALDQTHPMSNADHIVKDIHDILRAYYEVTLERFKDNVLKQATDYFLLSGPDTPLNLFSPTFVSALTPDEVEHIAGEAPKVKRRRAQLGREIRSLSEAKAILIRG
ncbi:hypothetical protein B0A54_15991 [Friedmanniomyces endolithicus]|uniref:GED domain-containing protein n=1 Tax=Friedmanniomyces endolithicus TaxID=329885 RepID=A0A4U0U1I4_9PEZI|nr:hypothetical protein B0A54_15991 [Friedmanniomyces endolithicus]